MKKVLATLALIVMLFTLTGCRESERVSWNISKEADNFNVMRRVTVVNLRNDTVMLTITGMCSVRYDSDGDLCIISKLSDGTYKKDMVCGVRQNDWTAYLVEDLSGAQVTPYQYEIEWMPEAIPVFTITNNN